MGGAHVTDPVNNDENKVTRGGAAEDSIAWTGMQLLTGIWRANDVRAQLDTKGSLQAPGS